MPRRFFLLPCLLTAFSLLLCAGCSSHPAAQEPPAVTGFSCDADVSYQACPAMLEETESMKKVLDADAVILVEHSGVSLISEINRQIIRLEKSGKKILGILLAE